MTHPSPRAAQSEWIEWLKWARTNPSELPSEIRFAIKQFDELAIEAAKLWFTQNRNR
jgi:hypothetical protein